MINIYFKVDPDGGTPYELTATSRDIVRWEGGGPDRASDQLGSNGVLSDLVELAWIAAVRQGYFVGTHEDFRASCDIDTLPRPARTAAGTDPTPPAR